MYEIAFCYPYDSRIFWDGRETNLNEHWLSIETIETNEFGNKEWIENYHNHLDNLSTIDIADKLKNSPFVRNPQIIESYCIGDTILCVIKTLWLKIFQRKYKNYYNKKIKYYKNPKNIMNRSIYGKWI